MPIRLPIIVPTLALLLGSRWQAAEDPARNVIVVQGVAVESYSAPDAQTATRSETPIAETPLSIQVVPAQVIRDQGDLRLKDAIRNVSGVAPVKTESAGIQFETAYVRGFSQLLYVDGVQFYTMPTVDLALVQRVEVLKGPASSLYGGMEPGGLINLVPKTPDGTASTRIELTAGSYDLHRAEADAQMPFGKHASGRIAAAIQDGDSYRDFLHQRSLSVAPSLVWAPDERTQISTWLWYQHLDRPVDQGVVFSYTGQPVGPISRNLAGPNYEQNQRIDDVVYGLQAKRSLGDGLDLRGRFLGHYFDGEMDALRFNAVTPANTITPYYDGSHFWNLMFDGIGEAHCRRRVGATGHDLLIGVELNRSNYHYNRLTATLPAINIYNPVYPNGVTPALVPGAAEQHTVANTVAGYAQEQMTAFGDRLHLLVGGRFDRVVQTHVAWQNGMEYHQDDNGVSGRAGLLYEVTSWLSPYINASRSFNPNAAGGNLSYDGSPLPSTTGIQYEAGLKNAFAGEALVMTTAAYQITKDHVPVADPSHAGFSLDAGEMRSRGIEWDACGRITPELQLIASYAHTLTEVVDSTTLIPGTRFANIPLNSGSAWANYTFRSGSLRDFGVGLGAFAASDRAGNATDTFSLPGYVRVDAGTWYALRLASGYRIDLQLNITNLFDRTYYESSGGTNAVQPGAPLTILGKCGITF